MKKILSIILVLGLLVPAPLCAKKKSFGNGLFWEITTDGTLVISGQGAMPDYDDKSYARSPWAKYARVKKYGDDSMIKKVVIDEGITHIGAYSFRSFGRYKKKDAFGYGSELSLPSTLRSIGRNAFDGTRIRGTLKIPNNVECIGEEAFMFTKIGGTLKIPNNVESIGKEAFWGTQIEEVVLGTGIKEIGDQAFWWCDELKKLLLPANIRRIGSIGRWSKNQLVIEFTGGVNENVIVDDDAFLIPNYPYMTPFVGKIINAPEKIKKNPSKYGISPQSIFYEDTRDEKGRVLFAAKEGCKVTKRDGYYHVNDNGSIGIADLTGKWIVPTTENYKSIEEGTSSIGKKHYIVTKDGKCGVMDDRFRLVFLLPCSSIAGLTTDLWIFSDNNYKGVINSNGQIIIPTTRRYTAIEPCHNDNNALSFTQGGYAGKCDLQGNEISKLITEDGIKSRYGYSSMTAFDGVSPKRYKVKKGGYYGVADANGNTIVEPEMDEIVSMGSNLLKFRIGSFWGVMNSSGNIIIPTSRGYTST